MTDEQNRRTAAEVFGPGEAGEPDPKITVPVNILKGIIDGTLTAEVSEPWVHWDKWHLSNISAGPAQVADRADAVAALEREFGPDQAVHSEDPDAFAMRQAVATAIREGRFVENPKDVEAQASGKPRLDLLEPVANQATAEALAFGAAKYGVQNYITIPIHARVYLAAIQRHLDAWKAGEDLAADSGVHHLGHIAANVHVALAALAAGSFVDDRGPGVPVDASISDPAKVET